VLLPDKGGRKKVKKNRPGVDNPAGIWYTQSVETLAGRSPGRREEKWK